MKRLRGSRGAVAVELAIVAPLLILFLIGAAQVGLVVIGNSAGSNAAREGGRTASIHFECADNHISQRCPTTPSANYTRIRTAVMAKLAGLVKESTVTVGVVCRAKSSTGAIVLCEKDLADPETDVIEVTVGWRHIGGTTFVSDGGHTSKARSVIAGEPDLSPLVPAPDTFPPGLVPPILASDPNHDGVIDKLTLTFDEAIVQTVSTSAFTVAISASGSNTISSATVSGRTVTLTLGGSTINTAPGAMTVSLAALANGIVDYSGNKASFTATTTADQAAPVLIGLSDAQGPGGVDGRIDALDALTLTFSEPIATPLVATTVAETDPSTSANDSVDILGITAGPQLTNANNYNNTNNSSFSVPAVVTKPGNTVVVTIATPLVCTPLGCGGRGAGNDSSAFAFTPAATLLDAAGNAATGSRTVSKIF